MAGDVPQGHRIGLGPVSQPGHGGDAFGHLALGIACGAQAAEVALDIRSEHRHPGIAEDFGQALQGHGLAGAGGPGYQAVAVGQFHGLGYGTARWVGAKNQGTLIGHFAFLGLKLLPDGADI
ncbi:hypothetical protein D9M68_795780 [compost metagenome]